MKTKFLHLRRMENDTILSTGGMTIAYLLNADNKVEGFAPARCHIHDGYNKQQGRVKATGRLKSPKYFVQIPLLDEQQFIQESHAMHKEICLDDTRQ